MKRVIVFLALSSFFFLSSTSMAKDIQKKSKKTLRHHCAVYTNSAKKAAQLYSENKNLAVDENNQVKALQSDQKRLPASAKMAKQVVDSKIQDLAQAKRQHLLNSLKYLEQHVEYTKAAKMSCASHKVEVIEKKKELEGQDISKYLTVASQ